RKPRSSPGPRSTTDRDCRLETCRPRRTRTRGRRLPPKRASRHDSNRGSHHDHDAAVTSATFPPLESPTARRFRSSARRVSLRLYLDAPRLAWTRPTINRWTRPEPVIYTLFSWRCPANTGLGKKAHIMRIGPRRALVILY